jgi:DNA polymerase
MIVALDFETFYSQDYSLRKMSETDYVLSPLFQTLMVAIKLGDMPTQVAYGEADVKDALASVPWDRVALLCHNTRFDGAILAWRFGHTPKLYLDTMSMARATTHAVLGSSSLASVARYMGLPPKGTEVVQALGKRYEDFTRDELLSYGDYCAHDTDLCREIFDRIMAAEFPTAELRVIDLALRMFITPQVRLDPAKLAEQLAHIRALKDQALAQFAHLDKSVFSSNGKFASLLIQHGVIVPTKVSPTTGETIPALARNDRAFKELCEDQTQPVIVQALLACRQGVKSTIDESRTETLLNLSLREWGPGSNAAGWMPVPYRYYGAHTGRFSGDGGYNFANLRRGAPIRDAITAPEGWRIVHRDSSQIECRMLAWLARCYNLTEAFREGRDVYSEFATRAYGYPVTRANALERFVGKTSVLGLGYGCGWAKFQQVLFIGSGGISVSIDEPAARGLVNLYRYQLFPEVVQLWKLADAALERMILRGAGYQPPTSLRTNELLPVVREGNGAELWLPNGLPMQYPDIGRVIGGGTDIYYDGPYGPKKIYGCKLVENICQALARIVVTDIARRVYKSTGYHPVLGTYDSWDYCVPEDEAKAFDDMLACEFATTPAWAQGLPLASEGGWGSTLLEAEQGVNQ